MGFTETLGRFVRETVLGQQPDGPEQLRVTAQLKSNGGVRNLRTGQQAEPTQVVIHNRPPHILDWKGLEARSIHWYTSPNDGHGQPTFYKVVPGSPTNQVIIQLNGQNKNPQTGAIIELHPNGNRVVTLPPQSSHLMIK